MKETPMPDDLPPLPPTPTSGPFYSAILSMLFATLVLVIVQAGLRLTLVNVLAVLIPGMTLSTMMVAVSMGWIFVSIGRLKQWPRYLKATWIIIAITMLELMWLTYVADAAGKME
jgi:hypothetical protein